MAQIGRISGPLLEANLERNGIDLAFRNDLNTVQVLYLDAGTGRIAVNNDAPATTIDTIGTTLVIDLLGDTATVANYTLSSNNVDVSTGDIFLNAGKAIVLSNLQTEEFFATDNSINTVNANTDIELRPNGTGSILVFNDLRIIGGLHATGDIAIDGTIIFGDSLAQDTVVFEADINSDILPNETDTYALATPLKRWNNLYTKLINGSLVTTGSASVAGIDLNKRQQYALYVATNGDDTNVGDHIQGPLATLQQAIGRIPANNTDYYTIYVFSGTYAEQLPLVLPPYVTVAGTDMTNTVIVPAANNQDKDVFRMNGQTIVQNLTVKNFYYNSGNNTGYAFRYAPNGVITSRSPYVQHVSVITQGSVTTNNDPRGFAIGDAGRGAYIDGAELSSASFDASMLFHSVTMITPGVDAVTMTNGVRVEWLNCFTYFANRGLYAENGASGRTGQDGSTINRGAEVRSIGSANVYGNFGAVADGTDCLMYLIQHNFAYIGTGKDVSNDQSLAIQSQETVEFNNGKIYSSSTDHLGTFRVGDNFFANLDSDITAIDTNTVSVNSLSGLRINTGSAVTTISGSQLETGAIRVSGNLIQSLTGNLNIAAGNDSISLANNTSVSADLNIVGNFSFDGTLNLAGNEVTDGLRFNVELEQNFNPNQHLQFSLGTPSKQWLAAYLNRLEAGDFSIYDNVIETNKTHADLELRANGTGLVRVPHGVAFSNALDVGGISTFDTVAVQGTLEQTGNLIQTGNSSISAGVEISETLTVGADAQLEEITISGNVVSTSTTNADLELGANGTGIVDIQESAQLQQNLSATDISAQADVTVTLTVSSTDSFLGNLQFANNYIGAVSANQDLILKSTQNISASANAVLLQHTLTAQGNTALHTVAITGSLNHTGNRTQTGNYALAGELIVDQILLEDNFIVTASTNTDLLLAADALGKLSVPVSNVAIQNNLTVGGTTHLQNVVITGSLNHTGNRTQAGNYAIAGEITNGNIIIEDNFVSTSISNSDLELRANGTGGVLIPNNNMQVPNDFTVAAMTEIQSAELMGTLTQFADRTQTGSYAQTGNFEIVGSVDINSLAQFTDVSISGNTLATTIGPNLVIAADGNATVLFESNLLINNDLFTRSITVAGDIVIDQDFNLENISIPLSIIDIADNYITTKVSNADLELRASGTGKVIFGNQGNTSASLIATFDNSNETFDNGNLTFDSAPVGQLSNLTFDNSNETFDNGNLTFDSAPVGQLSNLTFDNSNETFDNGNLTFDTVFVNDLAVRFSQNLIVGGATNLAATLLIGSVTHNGDTAQLGNYQQTGNLVSDSASISKSAVLSDITIDQNNISASNGSLQLAASGVGLVTFSSLAVQQDITASALTAGDIVIDDSLALELLESSTDIQIFDNVITTTNSNSDLELRANGAGHIQVADMKFRVGTISTDTAGISITAIANVNIAAAGALKLPAGTTEQIVVEEIQVLDGGSATLIGNLLDGGNSLTVFTSNSIIYNAGSSIISLTGTAGSLRFNTDDDVFEGFAGGVVTFNGVYSSDRRTNVLAHDTNNSLLFTVNQIPVGSVSSAGLAIHGLQADSILFDTNKISTTVANANLNLSANGIGELAIDNLSVKNNLIKNNNSPIIFVNTGSGYSKLAGTSAAVFPSGTVAERPASAPQTGDTRFNTDIEVLEVWDGSTYITAAGTSATISAAEFNDLVLEFTLILG